MDYALSELCRFFAAAKRHAEPLVLATILRTEASTYRKAGARILIRPDGHASGLLSGGCLEADLRERAVHVLAAKRCERVWLDTRKADDALWGSGVGCEGAMDIWLQPSVAGDEYPVLSYLQHCLESETDGCVATVVGGEAAPEELGVSGCSGVPSERELPQWLASLASNAPELRKLRFQGRELEVFVSPVGLPVTLLVCGASSDAIPLCAQAAALGWRVSIYDHRPAFAAREHFPQAVRVLLGRPQDLADKLAALPRFDAVMVMSHHLAADAEYLAAFAAQPPRYLGLLGPPPRRARVLQSAGAAAETLHDALRGALYAPAGLDIGAGTAPAIALSIVAEIHAVLNGRRGLPMSQQPG